MFSPSQIEEDFLWIPIGWNHQVVYIYLWELKYIMVINVLWCICVYVSLCDVLWGEIHITNPGLSWSWTKTLSKLDRSLGISWHFLDVLPTCCPDFWEAGNCCPPVYFFFKKTENMSSFRVELHPSWSSTYDFPYRFVHFLWMIGIPYRVIFVGANRGWFTTVITSKTGRFYASKLGKERFFIIGEMDPSECGTRRDWRAVMNEWPLLPPKKKDYTPEN